MNASNGEHRTSVSSELSSLLMTARLERLQRRRLRERQLRTGDRESADDRLTSATDKTTPALSEYIESPDGRLERLQRRRQREGQTEICQRTILSPCFQLCQKKNWFSRKTFVWMRQAGYSTSREGLVVI